MGVLQNYIRAAALSGKKRGRHPILNAQQFYPRALERELEQKTVAEFLRIFEELKAQASLGFASVQDDTMDLINTAPELSSQFVNEVKRIGTRIDTQTHTNYSKQLELTIGAPYYPPGTPETILNEWHATFQELCVSATTQGKTNIAYLTAKAKQDGWNKQQLEKEIEKQLLPQFRHRAELIARTETAKLNSRCTLETYKSTGVEYYKWLTTLDDRARASHHAMNGKICSVSDSEVYFEENPDNPLAPIKHTRSGAMYHGHPGTDFQCRCSMVMWDPELDGTFEVKEEHRIEQEEKEKSKEQEAEERIKQAEAEKEQAKQEAEQAKAEAETARQEVEQARQEKEKAEKELNALNQELQTNSREAIQRINKNHVAEKGVLIEEINSFEKAEEALNRLLAKNPEYQLQNVKLESQRIDANNSFIAMQSIHNEKKIILNSKFSSIWLSVSFEFENILNKIRKGFNLDFNEEYLIETLNHELLHLRAKGWEPLEGTQRLAMETINQFVSRHTYDKLLNDFGGQASFKSEIIKRGEGYYAYLTRLNCFLAKHKINSYKVATGFYKILLNSKYSTLENELYIFFNKYEKVPREKFVDFFNKNSLYWDE